MVEQLGINTRPLESVPQTGDKPLTFFFISGLGGADHGIKPIKDALQSIEPGSGVDAVVWNSVLSSDPKTKKRWSKMGEQALDILEQDRRLVFIAHSGGAAELAKVIDKMAKSKPDILK